MGLGRLPECLVPELTGVRGILKYQRGAARAARRLALAGKPEGIKRVRGTRVSVGVSNCASWPGCDPAGGCCARRVPEAARDFPDQKGACKKQSKHWATVFFSTQAPICGNDFEALCLKPAPVTNASSGSYRLALRAIDAYSAGVQYESIQIASASRGGKRARCSADS